MPIAFVVAVEGARHASHGGGVTTGVARAWRGYKRRARGIRERRVIVDLPYFLKLHREDYLQAILATGGEQIIGVRAFFDSKRVGEE